MYATTISCSVALFLIIIFLVLVRSELIGLLKDQSTLPISNAPFSLSRTLLFFWTMIIFLSVCYIGIVRDDLIKIDSGVLILMGIIIGTTTVGKTIDNSQPSNITKSPSLIQNIPSNGFLNDILTDKNGISVSRLQSVIFNIIYGCVFISIVISENTLYNFPKETLTLLGISSGGYVLMKIPEN